MRIQFHLPRKGTSKGHPLRSETSNKHVAYSAQILCKHKKVIGFVQAKGSAFQSSRISSLKLSASVRKQPSHQKARPINEKGTGYEWEPWKTLSVMRKGVNLIGRRIPQKFKES